MGSCTSIRASAAALAIAGSAGLASAQFEGIGFLPGGDESFASGVSGDGLTVVGAAYDPAGGTFGFGGYEAARWTPGAGLEPLGRLPGGEGSWAFGASADGSTVAGGACEAECLSAQPFRWRDPGPIEGLGYLAGNTYAYGYGVSDDGAVIVGFGIDAAYAVQPIRWTQAAGIAPMQRFPGGGAAYVLAASGDGAVMVGRGFDDQRREQAARWTTDGVIEGLGFLPPPIGTPMSRAHAVTPDGAVIVGVGYGDDLMDNDVYQGFRWTSAGGMQGLGVDGADGYLGSTCALDVSADGRLIVGAWGGEQGAGEGSRAAVWLEGVGWRDLAAWLAGEHGITEPADWQLAEATAVSNDGTVIVGWGVNAAGRTEGFVVTLPGGCAADFDGDGTVDTRDVLAFLNAWAAGDPRADFNADGAIDTRDVLAFLNVWTAGC